MGYQDGAQNVAKQIAKNPSSRKLEKATLIKHGHRISYQNDRAFGHTSPSQVSMPFFGPLRRMNSLSLSSLVVECAGPAPQSSLCFRCLSTLYPARERQREGSMFCFCFKLNISSPKGSGPRSEVVLYRGNPWLGQGKPLFHSPVPKISLIYELLNEQRIRY